MFVSPPQSLVVLLRMRVPVPPPPLVVLVRARSTAWLPVICPLIVPPVVPVPRGVIPVRPVRVIVPDIAAPALPKRMAPRRVVLLGSSGPSPCTLMLLVNEPAASRKTAALFATVIG